MRHYSNWKLCTTIHIVNFTERFLTRRWQTSPAGLKMRWRSYIPNTISHISYIIHKYIKYSISDEYIKNTTSSLMKSHLNKSNPSNQCLFVKENLLVGMLFHLIPPPPGNSHQTCLKIIHFRWEWAWHRLRWQVNFHLLWTFICCEISFLLQFHLLWTWDYFPAETFSISRKDFSPTCP